MRRTDKPLVDPPEFGDRIKDTDNELYWIPGGLPTIFQNVIGELYKYIHKEVDLNPLIFRVLPLVREDILLNMGKHYQQ